MRKFSVRIRIETEDDTVKVEYVHDMIESALYNDFNMPYDDIKKIEVKEVEEE